MDVKSKQKPKKRRTRRSLDNLRKRSRIEVKNNVKATSENILELKNVPKCNDEVITCKRLTLELFKKTVTSKIVTRAPLSTIDNRDSVKAHNIKAVSNNLTQYLNPPQFQNKFNGINKSSMVCKTKSNTVVKSPNAKYLFNKNAWRVIAIKREEPDTVTSPLQNGIKDFEESTSKEFIRLEYFNKSCSNSEIESGNCSYEKFIDNLPSYLKEHFPALSSSFLNKNIACLKQSSLENGYHEIVNDIGTTVNNLENKELIIENPMNYIQTGLSWKGNVKKKPSILLSKSSSSSLSEYGSSTSDIFLNSPEYQYYPHKLNQ